MAYVLVDRHDLASHRLAGRLFRRAGRQRITSPGSRHTALTLVEHADVPISIISKRAGHGDSAFTQKTYVHASGDDLQRPRPIPRCRRITTKPPTGAARVSTASHHRQDRFDAARQAQ
jgi:hypothetical protein